MKLLDPFAGIILTRGHYVYHCAFLFASLFVNTKENPNSGADDNYDVII